MITLCAFYALGLAEFDGFVFLGSSGTSKSESSFIQGGNEVRDCDGLSTKPKKQVPK